MHKSYTCIYIVEMKLKHFLTIMALNPLLTSSQGIYMNINMTDSNIIMTITFISGISCTQNQTSPREPSEDTPYKYVVNIHYVNLY